MKLKKTGIILGYDKNEKLYCIVKFYKKYVKILYLNKTNGKKQYVSDMLKKSRYVFLRIWVPSINLFLESQCSYKFINDIDLLFNNEVKQFIKKIKNELELNLLENYLKEKNSYLFYKSLIKFAEQFEEGDLID